MALEISDVFASGGLDLTVFDPVLNRPDFAARGLPYKPDPAEPLLNAPGEMMSVRRRDPADFLRWLERTAPYPAGRETYVTRPTFGRYLAETFDELRQRWGQRDGVLHCVPENVIDAWKESDGTWTLLTPHARFVRFDFVILCVGWAKQTSHHPETSLPADPLVPALRKALQGPTVAIAGCGLTSMDVVRALLSRGYEGRITLASRSGLLPAIRSRHASPRLRALQKCEVGGWGALSLADLTRMIADEASALEIDIRTPRSVIRSGGAADAVEYLSSSRNDDWGALFVAICDEAGPSLWNHLDWTSRHAFRRYLHRYFQAWCNPMPAITGDLLIRAISSGQVSVRAGLLGFDTSALRFSDGTIIRADTIIDATRDARLSLASLGSPLVRSLVDRGYTGAHEFGGVRVRFGSWGLTRSDGEVVPGLYAVGSLTQGERYYVNALDSIVETVGEVAADIRRAQAARAGTGMPLV